ncbi:MAG: sulfotransferase family 2 domain-containing protein [Okeania sp. SIO2H7]|nr:sulfotransferase family 2 domain-containing protein [Okeania sp. SIO2H7]
MLNRDEVKIISVHIPKTAGTAFRNVLIKVYGEDKVLADYKKKNINELLTEIETKKIKAIHGHFKVEKYENHFAEAKRIIWLREPIKRLISNYWHQITRIKKRIMGLELADLDKELSKEALLSYASQHQIRNLMSSYFKTRGLKDFWFVGITEFLQEDLTFIKEKLGWPNVNALKINKHQYADKYRNFTKKIFLDEELMEKLRSLHLKDIELYERALKLRENNRKDKNKIVPAPSKSRKAGTVLKRVKKQGQEQPKKPIKRIYIRGCFRSGSFLMLYLFGVGFKNTYLLKKEQIPTEENSKPGRITVGKCTNPQRKKETRVLAENFLNEPDGAVIFTLRDPRDVLLSEKGLQSASGLGNPTLWIENAKLLKSWENHPQVVPVKFEDLLTKPNEIQEQIAKRLGLEILRPFSECWKHLVARPGKFSGSDVALAEGPEEDTKKNNRYFKAIKPPELSQIGHWKTDSKKKEYIENKLEENSEIFPLMEHFGYLNPEGEVTVKALRKKLRKRPGFTEGAIKFLKNFFKENPDAKVLEFGSGGSTMWLSKLAGKLVSVEDDVEWYSRVKKGLRRQGRENKVDLRLLAKPYYEVCKEFSKAEFDLVIVDGSDRFQCLKASVRVLKPGGILMLDDAERKVGKKAQKMLENWQVKRSRENGKETRWWQKTL